MDEARKAAMSAEFLPGMRVTVTYRAEHNHAGTLLAVNDPRAWAETMAFTGRTPTQAEVDEHLAGKMVAGVFASESTDPRVPIEWDFGKVYWEPTSAIRFLTRDWRVNRVVDKGPRAYYRYQIEGENLNCRPDDRDRRFSWAIPGDPRTEPRYDLTRAVWETQAPIAAGARR